MQAHFSIICSCKKKRAFFSAHCFQHIFPQQQSAHRKVTKSTRRPPSACEVHVQQRRQEEDVQSPQGPQERHSSHTSATGTSTPARNSSNDRGAARRFGTMPAGRQGGREAGRKATYWTVAANLDDRGKATRMTRTRVCRLD